MNELGAIIDDAPSKSDDNTQWLLTGNLPCLGDGYNLRGLVGPIVKCPECGHLNDLRDPSPWRKQDLPLGVMQREHWPASAALYSMLIPFAALLGYGFTLGYGLPGTALGVVLFLIAIAAWGSQCRNFVRSTRSLRWAYLILIGTHLAPAFTLAGMLGGILILERIGNDYPTTTYEIATGLTLLLPIGLALFAWLKHQLIQNDNPTVFRVDWQNYRVPVGELPTSVSET